MHSLTEQLAAGVRRSTVNADTLAERLNVSETHVRAVLAGEVQVSLSMWDLLFEAAGIQTIVLVEQRRCRSEHEHGLHRCTLEPGHSEASHRCSCSAVWL